MFNLESYNPELADHRNFVRKYNNTNANFKHFMENIPEETNSDFVIATGDIIDFFEAEALGEEKLAYQVEQFVRLKDLYHFPIFLTLGNHDLFSYDWGEEKVIFNQLNTGRAKATWIRNFDCFRDGTYYNRTYVVGETRFHLIFLDNGFYHFPKEEKVVNPYIDKPQLHWLRKELREAGDDIVIVLMHIPFSDISVLPESQNELYKELNQNSSVKLIFAGHRHKNEVKHFTSDGYGEIIQIETGALARSLENWRVINLTNNSIIISKPGVTDTELIIPIN
jgi:3',5'-cyclic AMP phosphodiesterase CpdA